MDSKFYDPKVLNHFVATKLCKNDSKLKLYLKEGNVKKFRARLAKKNNNDDVENVIYVFITNIIRTLIYDIISDLTKTMKPFGDLILTGGDAFNYYFEKEDRIITSDIDTKFTPRYNDESKFFGELQMMKLILFDELGKIAKLKGKVIKERIVNTIKGSSLQKVLGISFPQKPYVKRRYSLIKKKRTNKTTNNISKGDVLIDVELFALDLNIQYFHPDQNKIKLVNLGGILDIAFMRPNEIGYEISRMQKTGISCIDPVSNKERLYPTINIASKRFLISDVYLMRSLKLRPEKKKKDDERILAFANKIVKYKIKTVPKRITPLLQKLTISKSMKSVSSNVYNQKFINRVSKINPMKYSDYTTKPNRDKLDKSLVHGQVHCEPVKGFQGSDGVYRFNINAQKWTTNTSKAYVKNQIVLRPIKFQQSMKKFRLDGMNILYGYSESRDNWLSDVIYLKSAMIPFVGNK
jgi:hypothetical protein